MRPSYSGHGAPVTRADLGWQRGHIETFLEAVRSADWEQPQQAAAAVAARMTELLPSDDLRFLMQLSIEPVAAGLGLMDAGAAHDSDAALSR